MADIELKPCPFCGNPVEERKGFGGVTFYECKYIRCGAVVSFCGNKKVAPGIREAENPRENWNRRAGNG